MNDLSTLPRTGMEPDGADSIESGKRLIRLSSDKGSSLAERLANQFYRLT